MARNTKVGLLVGLLFIIGIGMVLSQQVGPPDRNDQTRGDGLASLVPPGGRGQAALGPSEPAQTGPIGLTAHRALAGGPSAPRPPTASFDEPIRPPGPPTIIGQVAPPGRSLVGAGQPGAGPTMAWNGDVQPVVPPPPVVDPGVGPDHVTGLPAGWKLHKVQPRETLSAVSLRYFQDRKHVELIFQANRDKLTDVNMVREGMELRIPPPPGRPTPAAGTGSPLAPGATPPPTIRPPSRPLDGPGLEPVDPRQAPSGASLMAGQSPPGPLGPTTTYRIKDGDTLSSIASEQLGSARQWEALYKINRDLIANPDRLTVGMTIRLPDRRLAMQNP